MALSIIANAVGTQVLAGAPSPELDDVYSAAAQEQARALIDTVPGSGPVRGAWRYNGDTYAFRDNAPGTECDMWKSTTQGWDLVDKRDRVQFDTGTINFTAGATLTGSISMATATIIKVINTTGDGTGIITDGTIVHDQLTGEFIPGDILTDDAGGAAVAASNGGPTVLQPGGYFEFVNFNFSGNVDTFNMYGCDGVSNAFEFDGDVFAPIYTGRPVDTPKYIEVHENHLFLTFPGGGLQNSGPTLPFNWEPAFGAAEFGFGAEMTGLLSMTGALVVTSTNNTKVLYGAAKADFVFKNFLRESGARDRTFIDMGIARVFLDASGLRKLSATQAFGDFAVSDISALIKPIFDGDKKTGRMYNAATYVKDKNEYLLFSDNSENIICDLSGKTMEFMLSDLGFEVKYASTSEDNDGTEWVLIGGDDGYVYQYNSGNRFDDLPISAYLHFAFDHFGTPALNKGFHSIEIEGDAAPTLDLRVSAQFNYGDPALPQQFGQVLEVFGGGGNWGEANWSEFFWGSQVEGQAKADIKGSGANIGIVLASVSAYESAHTLSARRINYTKRGVIR